MSILNSVFPLSYTLGTLFASLSTDLHIDKYNNMKIYK